MQKKALFSVYDTNQVEEFAKILIDDGWEIIASKETVDILSRSNLPVTGIDEFTNVYEDYGFPPTLHPKVESYLTSESKDDRIDLVYVINYPLSIGNDVGGRTLLALAAKGKRIPVMSIEDMSIVINEIRDHKKISYELHEKLIEKVNVSISQHFFNLIKEDQNYDAIFGFFKSNLMNGENPYQIPSTLFSIESEDSLSIANFKQLAGEPPCYTNLADSDSIVYTLCLCSEAFKINYKKIPYICIAAKHGNPCGMAIDWEDPKIAINKALFGNPLAIWGGEVITNFEIDIDIANLLLSSVEREKIVGNSSWMLDVILSPKFTDDAIEILSKRKQRKLLENSNLFHPFVPKTKWSYRFIRGSFLRQPPQNYILNLSEAEYIGKGLSNNIIDSIIIAWSVAFSSNHGGNEVSLAKDNSLISCGGAPSTVEAVQLALVKADNCGHATENAVFAADAFFPFYDAPELLINAGVIAGIVPAGGKAIETIKSTFLKERVNVYYILEEYRGFCRH